MKSFRPVIVRNNLNGPVRVEITVVFTISITSPPVPPSIENSNQIVVKSTVIGQSITLECVASGTPKPHIKWIRGEESLSFVTNPNLLMVDGGKKLQIINAQLLDADGYTCVASNIAGNTTKEFLLKVLGGW